LSIYNPIRSEFRWKQMFRPSSQFATVEDALRSKVFTIHSLTIFIHVNSASIGVACRLISFYFLFSICHSGPRDASLVVCFCTRFLVFIRRLFDFFLDLIILLFFSHVY
jgi:hypothetical protein